MIEALNITNFHTLENLGRNFDEKKNMHVDIHHTSVRKQDCQQ
jgi:hypothetical protein